MTRLSLLLYGVALAHSASAQFFGPLGVTWSPSAAPSLDSAPSEPCHVGFTQGSAAACEAQSRASVSTKRKSIQFGPQHATRRFITREYVASRDYNSATSSAAIGDKHKAALQLANELVGSRGIAQAPSSERGTSRGFFVRQDSFVDPQSGLAHVYVKQTVNGLVVDDANLHVVFSDDGQILQYSTSLYGGDVPEAFTNPAEALTSYSDEYCILLRAKIGALLAEAEIDKGSSAPYNKRDQIVLASDGKNAGVKKVDDDLETSLASAIPLQHVKTPLLGRLQRELFKKCDDPSDSPYLQGSGFSALMPGALEHQTSSHSMNAPVIDARLATLEFVKSATADAEVRARLSASLQQVAASVTSTFEQSARPDGHAEQVEKLYQVPGASDTVTAKLGYLQGEDGRLNLVWRLEVPMDFAHNSNFYQVTVDSTTGAVRSSVDWVSGAPVDSHAHEIASATTAHDAELEALYRVIRWGLNDPSEGNRTTESSDGDRTASPYGWHTVPGKAHYDDTRGNNVIASAFGAGMEDYLEPVRSRPLGKRAENGSLLFDFPFPWRAANQVHEPLSPDKYADASTVNLFYALNEYHDLMFRYGFTPAAGNFEEAESSEGGRGGDAIVAYSISSAGINNADFTTPPDGSKPRVRMYKWHTKENATERDGDFELGIIIHEMTHGISTRLTGGPSDSSCLGWGESGGMGEGWGDLFATLIRRKTPTRDIYTMGSWASHQKSGIRKYPYSTNLTINPETYKTLDQPGYWGVHAIGEVWAGVLYQVEEGLRAKHGWAPDLFPPSANATQEEHDKFFLTPKEVDELVGSQGRPSKRPIPRQGNTLAVQLIVDGMKLQPCRPSFFDARDAIIQADKHLTGGANACLLWERFAQRGLGIDAKVVGRTPWGGGVRTNGHKVPAKCSSKQ